MLLIVEEDTEHSNSLYATALGNETIPNRVLANVTQYGSVMIFCFMAHFLNSNFACEEYYVAYLLEELVQRDREGKLLGCQGVDRLLKLN